MGHLKNRTSKRRFYLLPLFIFLISVSVATAQNKVVVIPLFGEEPTGDAQSEDVLEGATFSSSSGTGLTGTIPNIGYQDITPSTEDQTISEGYHDGSGKVAGDPDLLPENIKRGVTIFDVAGKLHGGCTCAGTLNGMRWCDNEDGTVTDMTTCLVWLKDASWGGQYPHWAERPSATGAHNRATQLEHGVGGLTDGSVVGVWRLPNIEELAGLANGTEAVRAADPRAFTGVLADFYWTSTTDAINPGIAKACELAAGSCTLWQVTDPNYYVWPVRSDN